MTDLHLVVHIAPVDHLCDGQRRCVLLRWRLAKGGMPRQDCLETFCTQYGVLCTLNSILDMLYLRNLTCGISFIPRSIFACLSRMNFAVNR